MKESLRNVGFYSVSTGSNHCFMIKSLRNVGFCSVSTGSNHCFMIKSLRNVGFYSLSNDTDQSMMTRRERERVSETSDPPPHIDAPDSPRWFHHKSNYSVSKKRDHT
jgi:hypothetical protein